MPSVAPYETPLPRAIDEIIASMQRQEAAGGPKTASRSEAEAIAKKQQALGRWVQFQKGIGKRYADCRFENFEAGDIRSPAVQSLREFCESFESQLDAGRGIVLLGPRGTGKDHLAVAAVRECIRSAGVTAEWTDGQQLFSEMRDRITDNESEGRRVRELVSPQILLISDPVPQDGKLTEYQQGILWQIIDGRYRRMLSTWITANATSEAELCSKMGAQLVDRIVGGALVVLTTGWKSYRVPGQVVKP